MPLIVAWYERWSGRIAAWLLQQAVERTPDVPEVGPRQPFRVLGPYLFREYPRQPVLGWNAAVEQPPQLPGFPTRPLPFLFGREQWPRQPWLGQGTPSDQDRSLKTPAPPWVPTRAWARWPVQPQYGWTPAQDVPPVVAADTPIQWTAIKPWARWQPQSQYGWNASVESTPIIEDLPSAREWTAVRQWARWAAQPQFGWGADVTPPIEIPLIPVLLPYVFRVYPPQPWLGWASAGDVPPTPVEFDTPPSWASGLPYLFREYPRQPHLGWLRAWDESSAPPPAVTMVWIINE